MINPIKSFNYMEQWLKPCHSDNPLPLMWFITTPYGILGIQISTQIVVEQKLSWHSRKQVHLDGIK
jgi:hypothetical protein